MDSKSGRSAAAPVAILSTAQVVLNDGETLDVAPFVKDRKAIKFMSKQDMLAVRAAAECAKSSGLSPEELNRAGIYVAVGILPFEEEFIKTLAEKSQAAGRFDMEPFSREAYPALNPLLTFKCLPNMPVFHISWNLGVQGPHFITYPGSGQWASALERALRDIRAGRVKHALVGAVGDQNNFLARHYFERVKAVGNLRDASAFWMLAEDGDRAVGMLRDVTVNYENFDVFQENIASHWNGPFELALEIDERRKSGARGPLELEWACPDGFSGSISLEIFS